MALGFKFFCWGSLKQNQRISSRGLWAPYIRHPHPSTIWGTQNLPNASSLMPFFLLGFTLLFKATLNYLDVSKSREKGPPFGSQRPSNWGKGFLLLLLSKQREVTLSSQRRIAFAKLYLKLREGTGPCWQWDLHATPNKSCFLLPAFLLPLPPEAVAQASSQSGPWEQAVESSSQPCSDSRQQTAGLLEESAPHPMFSELCCLGTWVKRPCICQEEAEVNFWLVDSVF